MQITPWGDYVESLSRGLPLLYSVLPNLLEGLLLFLFVSFIITR